MKRIDRRNLVRSGYAFIVLAVAVLVNAPSLKTADTLPALHQE